MLKPYTVRIKSDLRPFWHVFDQLESEERARSHGALALRCGATAYQIAIQEGYRGETIIEEKERA